MCPIAMGRLTPWILRGAVTRWRQQQHLVKLAAASLRRAAAPAAPAAGLRANSGPAAQAKRRSAGALVHGMAPAMPHTSRCFSQHTPGRLQPERSTGGLANN